MTLRTRPRRWTCPHGCQPLNEPGKRKCATCGIGRTTKRTSLQTRADMMWSKLIKGNGSPCARCGRSPQAVVAAGLRMEAAHGVGRGKSKNVRWHPKNGVPLCGPVGWKSCHNWYDGEADDLARAEFTISVIGRAAYDEISRMRNEQWDRDYIRVIADLRQQLEREKP